MYNVYMESPDLEYVTFRDHFVFAPSHWETTLHCNVPLVGWGHTQNVPCTLSYIKATIASHSPPSWLRDDEQTLGDGISRDPFHKEYMNPELKLWGNLLWCNYVFNHPIRWEIHTCHDSPAVVTCVKLSAGRSGFFSSKSNMIFLFMIWIMSSWILGEMGPHHAVTISQPHKHHGGTYKWVLLLFVDLKLVDLLVRTGIISLGPVSREFHRNIFETVFAQWNIWFS